MTPNITPEALDLPTIIASMRNFAGVAEQCEITQGHAPVAIRNWIEMLEALAAQPASSAGGPSSTYRAHPSGDGSICEADGGRRLSANEILAAMNAAPVAGEAAQQRSACGHCLLDVGHDPGCKGLVEEAGHTPVPAAVPAGLVKVATWGADSPSTLQWLPGFTRSSFPDGTSVFAGLPAAQGVDLGADAAMAAEYRRWMDFYHAGGTGAFAWEEFLAKERDSQHQQQESGDG